MTCGAASKCIVCGPMAELRAGGQGLAPRHLFALGYCAGLEALSQGRVVILCRDCGAFLVEMLEARGVSRTEVGPISQCIDGAKPS